MPPPPHSPRRQASDFDDSAEDDLQDAGNPHHLRQERMKQLAHDLIGRWYWIILGLILGFLGATYQLSKTPKQYTASATLLIKQRTISVMTRDQVDEIDPGSGEGMNTIAERIRRLDLLERVASRQDVRDLPGLVPAAVDWTPEWLRDKLGKERPAPETAKREAPPAPTLGGMMAGWLGISIRRGTRLLDISITHPVPEVAKALADAIAREYLAEIANARSTDRSSSKDLLERESKEIRTSLQAASSALSIYSRTLEVHKALDAKELEFSALQRRYLPKHPKMVAATAELKELQERFLNEFEISRQAASDSEYWKVAAKELPDRQKNPDEYLRMARQQVLARIGVLESETQSSNALYNSMVTRIKEASVNEKSDESSAVVSNLARVPGWPSGPIPNKVLSTGAMGGLVGGLLLALLLARLDNKFHTVSQLVGETGVTVLAAVAEIKLHHLAAAERAYWKRKPGAKNSFQKAWNERLVFRDETSATSYAEMYRVLRTSVALLGDESKRKVTLFSSALPGEGKTLTSSNFALAAAGQGRKTLLIDLDLRKPSVHKLFGLAREQEQGGITECLANLAPFEQVIVQDTGHENLHLILSGKRAPNPGELLNTARMQAVLEQACRAYDVVVLDTAPLLAVPDTRIIAPLANNVCLVVQAEYVPKGAVRRTLKTLEEDGTHLSGVIFNGFKEKRRLMGENYSYGYYKSSRYGRSYRYGYGAYGAYGSDSSDEK